MAIPALLWALEQEIPSHPKMVLIMLANWWNLSEQCAWPTHEQLSTLCGMSVSSVKRHLNWLVKRNLVIRVKRMRNGRQVSNRYCLPIIFIEQGVGQDGLPRGVILTYPVGQIDRPSNTVIDTIKDTIKFGRLSGGPKNEGYEMISVVGMLDAGHKSFTTRTKEEIFSNLKRKKDGNLTPHACGYLWRNASAHARSSDGGPTMPELTRADRGRLSKVQDRIGADFPEVVWAVMSDWGGFISYAEKHSDAFDSPLSPSLGYFQKFADVALGYYRAISAPVREGGVKLIAQKPLTKPTAKTHTGSNPSKLTLEELAAIKEDLG